MKFLTELYDNCEAFRLFTLNAGVGATEIKKFIETLKKLGDFHPVTFKFIEICSDNKRFMYFKTIATKYQKLYHQCKYAAEGGSAREEKVTIISAQELDDSKKNAVLEALKESPHNADKVIEIEYKIDENILGGLQMYTESEFMDLSLSSRLDRLQSDISKITE